MSGEVAEADAAIAARLAGIWQRVAEAATAAGREADQVMLVAVTKGVAPPAIRSAHATGLRHFGENRVAEAETKQASLGDLIEAPTWHLVGHLQRNKAKRALALFQSVDSVDSPRLGELLDRLAAAEERRLPILLEVNVSGEVTKHGVPPAEVVDVARRLAALPYLLLQGLMTVGPLVEDRAAVAAAFERLAVIRAEVARAVTGLDLFRLSMGMSDDFDLAVAAGATELRIGRALFADEWPA